MNWQAFSESAVAHPGLAWAFCLTLGVRLVLLAPSSLRTLLLVLVAETALDAYFTGAFSPLPAGSQAAENASIAFVILGDLRLFLLLVRYGRPGWSWPRVLVASTALAFLVPVLQAVALRALPAVFADARRIYLVYEVMAVGLTAALVAGRWATRGAGPAIARWLERLQLTWLVMYGLWALCDVLILDGQAWAFALRLVPNAIYYGLFLYAAASFAPPEAARAAPAS